MPEPTSWFELRTPRLRLIPLPPELLRRSSEDRSAVERALGIRSAGQVPESLAADYREALSIWREAAEQTSDDYRWITPWEIVLASQNKAIGAIGFAGAPNAGGWVYLGYWTDIRYQGKGFMTETVGALTEWAFEDPRVQSVGASCSAANEASKQVLLKNGFEPGGEWKGDPLFSRRRR